MTRKLAPFLAVSTLLTGCYARQQAIYVSPYNGSSQEYHTLPLQKDSAHTGVYARASFFGGGANANYTDHVSGASASVEVAQHGGMFQWYYGLNGSLGSYKLGKWSDGFSGFPFGDLGNYSLITIPPATAKQLDAYGGPKTFGGGGISAGVNCVIPMGQGEWRFLGLETAMHQELGDYLHFRKKLPDSLATYIVRRALFGTAGLSTEFICRTRQGEFGFRLAHGWVLGAPYTNAGIYDSVAAQPLTFRYSNFSFHYTFQRYTIFYQLEDGKKSLTERVGLTYRFGKPRLPAKSSVERPNLRQRPALPSWLPHRSIDGQQ